jgi:hypothetical protein
LAGRNVANDVPSVGYEALSWASVRECHQGRMSLRSWCARSPKRPFFFRRLYLVVGDAVRTDFHTASRSGLEDALTRAGNTARVDAALAKWVRDSRELIAHPERFDYSAWCDGGLAREALAIS